MVRPQDSTVPSAQVPLQVQAPPVGSRIFMGTPGFHCSSGGAWGACTGTTISVGDTLPPALATTLKARFMVLATISLKEYRVYANFLSASAGMPARQTSGIFSYPSMTPRMPAALDG